MKNKFNKHPCTNLLYDGKHKSISRQNRFTRWLYMAGDDSSDVFEDAEIILVNKLPKLEKVEDNDAIID